VSGDRLIKAEVSGKTYREAVLRSQASGRTIGQELDALAKEPRAAPAPGARPWSAAIATNCAAGHRHVSRLEARVCDRLAPWCASQGYVLFQQVRLPLFALAPRTNGRPLYASIDFAVLWNGKVMRLIDAKGRVSREWIRGAAALEASTGVKVEEATAETLRNATRPAILPIGAT